MKRELFFASNQTNPILKLVSSQFVPAFLLPIRPRVLPTRPLPVSVTVRVIWLKRFV